MFKQVRMTFAFDVGGFKTLKFGGVRRRSCEGFLNILSIWIYGMYCLPRWIYSDVGNLILTRHHEICCPKGQMFRWRTRRHWSGPSSVAESKLRRLCEGVSSLESMCRGPCELLGYRTQHTYLLLSPFASLGSERLGSIPEVWSILKYEICLYSIFRIGGLHFVLEQLYVSSLRFGSAAIFSRCRSWKSWCLVWMDHSAKLMASFVAVPMACWCLFLKSADTIPKMPVWPNISGFS